MHTAFQGYLKQIELLSNSSENECLLFKFLADKVFFAKKLLASAFKITGIRLCAVLDQRTHEMHCLVKTVHKSWVMNSWGCKLFIRSFIWESFTWLPWEFPLMKILSRELLYWMNQMIIHFTRGMASLYFSACYKSMSRNVG